MRPTVDGRMPPIDGPEAAVTGERLDHTQRAAFLAGEGDAYARRNREAASPSSESVQRITRWLPEDGSLLEVGCGDGRLLRALGAELGPSWTLSGLDPSRSAIDELVRQCPAVDARIGTADELPFDGPFDAIVLGFFLYVVDRALLFRVASEIDRALGAGSAERPSRLFIMDFDPPEPVVNEYHHLPGLKSWKMDYSRIFLANPDYRLREHSNAAPPGGHDPSDAVGFWVLDRVSGSGYRPQR